MTCSLYHGDCLEIMPALPTGSVDLILCDPPYGTIKGMVLERWNKETTKVGYLHCAGDVVSFVRTGSRELTGAGVVCSGSVHQSADNPHTLEPAFLVPDGVEKRAFWQSTDCPQAPVFCLRMCWCFSKNTTLKKLTPQRLQPSGSGICRP